MADSGALRARRARRHRAGDHSLCTRCAAIRGGPGGLEGQEGPEIPADSVDKLRWLAEGLARAYAADPGNALLARELRLTLAALMPQGGGSDGDLSDLFAELSSA